MPSTPAPVPSGTVFGIDLFAEKLWATLGMLLLTLLCCYAPWFLRRKWRKSNKLISVLNCLAGGVVLGALLMHMLPETILVGEAGACGHSHDFQWGLFSAGVSFLLLFSVDRMFLSHAHCENESGEETKLKDAEDAGHSHDHSHGHHHHHDHSHSHDHHHHDHIHRHDSLDSMESQGKPHDDCHEADIMGGCHMEGIRGSKSRLQTFVFVFALSLHSLLEGLGMSGKSSMADLNAFLVGLFAHKWIEAFALGVTVVSAKFSRKEAFWLMAFYTVLTPVGILIGMAGDMIASSSTVVGSFDYSLFVSVIFNGLASGSFLFVSCIEMLPPEFHTRNSSTPIKFSAVCLGFLIMAYVSTLHFH